jgi:DNA-directed RNA polymerase specialized sigma subunit
VAQDINAQIASYRGICEGLARRLSAGRRAKARGAEYDDLVQEGLIDVWLTLARGRTPSVNHIENRMRDYIRNLGRATRSPADPMLSFDDTRAVEAG